MYANCKHSIVMVVDYEVVEAMVMEMGECGVQHTMFPYARKDHVNVKNDEVVVNLACKLNTHVDVDELESSNRVQTTTPEIKPTTTKCLFFLLVSHV